MNRKFKLSMMLLVTLLALSLIAACGSDNNENDNNNGDNGNNNEAADGNNESDNNSGDDVEKEEITIRWAHQWGEDHFWETIGDVVEDEFPHITFDIQDAGTDHPEDLEKLVAAKKSPDVISLGLVTHTNFLDDLGLAYDHDDLIENSDFDLDRLEENIVQYARNADPNDEQGLYAISNARPTWSLHYNKDVFDTLGVDYPEDGLTWQEVTDLAKDLTREVDGVQYRGLDLDVPNDAYTQFSEINLDPETDEVEISDGYRRFLEMVGEVVDIPGNYPADEPGELLYNWGSLYEEGNIAMAPAPTNWGWLEDDNIDIATYPVWEGYEGLNPVPNAGGWAITEPSKHKEDVLEVINHLLSDEVQIEKSKNGGSGSAEGGTSILTNPEVLDAFGEDNPVLQDKNVDSLFKYDYATGPEELSEYGGDGIPWEGPKEYVDSDQDINEFLRELKERIEETVRSNKASE